MLPGTGESATFFRPLADAATVQDFDCASSEQLQKLCSEPRSQMQIMNKDRIMWSIVVAIVLVTIATVSQSLDGFGQTATSPQKEKAAPTPDELDVRDLTKYGIVDYDAPMPANSAAWQQRFVKNQRYDNQDWVFPKMRPGVGGIGRVQDHEPAPLLPIDESQLIVEGKVVKAEAFLSNDKKGVYTEFTIRISNVVKNRSSNKAGSTIVADREGGVVRYPGGQRVKYEDSAHELPQKDSTYLFFLRIDSINPNYQILTAYELIGEQVRQMDKGRSFDTYKNLDKSVFLDLVRNKVSKN